MTKNYRWILTMVVLFHLSCQTTTTEFDASGTFEAVEVIVPAQAEGIIQAFNLEEGSPLLAGQVVGYIDSTQLTLKKRQLEAQVRATLGKMPDMPRQLGAVKAELSQALHELQRNQNLAKDGAIPGKQLDDAKARVEVLKKQLSGAASALSITGSGLTKETRPILAQIDQLNDQLAKCKITNPISGTVLSKYAETYEMAMPGKPLYKIADLSAIILRTYISGSDLEEIKPGMQLGVFTGAGNNKSKRYQGTITWISSNAEFTPKTIQTKDERANLVYAVKIRVKNDGYLKIGMYGDVMFKNTRPHD